MRKSCDLIVIHECREQQKTDPKVRFAFGKLAGLDDFVLNHELCNAIHIGNIADL